MARIRYIKPEIGTDEELAEVSIAARFLFVMLPTHCDKSGRMEDSPRRLKLQTFPWDDVNVDVLLNELDPRFIIRYEVEGKRFLQVRQFSKHQRPHPSEAISTIPQPPTENIKKHDKKLKNISKNVFSRQHAIGTGTGTGTRDGDGDGVVEPAAQNAEIIPPVKKLTPQQIIIRYFKEAKGIHSDDKDWDRKHIDGRLIKEAISYLKAFDGDVKTAGEFLIIKGVEWAALPEWGMTGAKAAAGRDARINKQTGADDGLEKQMGADRVVGPRRLNGVTRAGSLTGDALRAIENAALSSKEDGDVDGPG